mmetsp:Transcript_2065/g.4883  ORF Transcript_2065/g.4883 Transcript_2065/m.4883 type:complete len:547 (-) Transcript_2065:713-2353(-)
MLQDRNFLRQDLLVVLRVARPLALEERALLVLGLALLPLHFLLNLSLLLLLPDTLLLEALALGPLHPFHALLFGGCDLLQGLELLCLHVLQALQHDVPALHALVAVPLPVGEVPERGSTLGEAREVLAALADVAEEKRGVGQRVGEPAGRALDPVFAGVGRLLPQLVDHAADELHGLHFDLSNCLSRGCDYGVVAFHRGLGLEHSGQRPECESALRHTGKRGVVKTGRRDRVLCCLDVAPVLQPKAMHGLCNLRDCEALHAALPQDAENGIFHAPWLQPCLRLVQGLNRLRDGVVPVFVSRQHPLKLLVQLSIQLLIRYCGGVAQPDAKERLHVKDGRPLFPLVVVVVAGDSLVVEQLLGAVRPLPLHLRRPDGNPRALGPYRGARRRGARREPALGRVAFDPPHLLDDVRGRVRWELEPLRHVLADLPERERALGAAGPANLPAARILHEPRLERAAAERRLPPRQEVPRERSKAPLLRAVEPGHLVVGVVRACLDLSPGHDPAHGKGIPRPTEDLFASNKVVAEEVGDPREELVHPRQGPVHQV